jgi:hypothetical protein
MINGIKGAALAAVLAASGMVSNAFALASLPFIEDFASNNANWLNGSSVNATWLPAGGVDDGAFIRSTGTVNATGFGTIVFRGNANADASGDAFVGNWITGGVSSFSTFVRHDAPMNLNVYARLDAGFGRAGSSVDFTVTPNTWTQLSVPIVDSTSSFQSYGGGNFTSVFGNILNIQIAMSATQNATLDGQTYTIDIARVSMVPEPGSLMLLTSGLLAIGFFRFRKHPKTKTD